MIRLPCFDNSAPPLPTRNLGQTSWWSSRAAIEPFAEITYCTTLVPHAKRTADLQVTHSLRLQPAYRSSIDGFTARRPSFVPFALALASPALTLCQVMPGSNPAKTPHI